MLKQCSTTRFDRPPLATCTFIHVHVLLSKKRFMKRFLSKLFIIKLLKNKMNVSRYFIK